MRIRDEVCYLPLGMTAVHFEKAFGVGGQLKSAEYLLLAGPYGKYLMQGCFHSEVQAAVFKYLDLLGLLWQKSISLAALDRLEAAMLKVLAELEELLPAWELDMNRATKAKTSSMWQVAFQNGDRGRGPLVYIPNLGGKRRQGQLLSAQVWGGDTK